MKGLVIRHKPKLREPYFVAGFAGWPNAAEVSTGCVEYLKNALKAKKFAHIEPWEFYDFASSRPLGTIDNGSVRKVDFPTNECFFWRNEESEQDLIILLGMEPQLRWDKYTKAVLQIAQEFKVKRIYTIGGAYAKVPHTKEMVLAVVNDSKLVDELRKNNIEFINYEGPISFSTTMLFAAKEKNIEGVGLWGYAPHYITVANPSIWYSVLRRLSKMLKLPLNLEGVKKAGEELYQQVGKFISQNPKLAEYVKQLETEYELTRRREPMRPEEAIREVEDLFKKKRKDGDFLQGG